MRICIKIILLNVSTGSTRTQVDIHDIGSYKCSAKSEIGGTNTEGQFAVDFHCKFLLYANYLPGSPKIYIIMLVEFHKTKFAIY